MKTKCVIIDDESNIRELITNIIKDNFFDIEVSAYGSSVVTGLKAIKENMPQLIFLDIEMQDGSGFDLLDSIDYEDFRIIFITAFNDYAIKAFKYSAVDYILKPVNILSFIKSVNKALSSIKEKHYYTFLSENLKSLNPSKLAVNNQNEIQYINVNDIEYIEGEGRYSAIFMSEGTRYLDSKIISHYEELLEPDIFFRVHKSYIINLKQVKSIKRDDKTIINMISGKKVPISRNKIKELTEKMKSI